MVSLILAIKEEAFGRSILLGKIPWLPSADLMNVKVSFGLWSFNNGEGTIASLGAAGVKYSSNTAPEVICINLEQCPEWLTMTLGAGIIIKTFELNQTDVMTRSPLVMLWTLLFEYCSG